MTWPVTCDASSFAILLSLLALWCILGSAAIRERVLVAVIKKMQSWSSTLSSPSPLCKSDHFSSKEDEKEEENDDVLPITNRHGHQEPLTKREEMLEARIEEERRDMRQKMATERKDVREAMKALNDHLREERTAFQRRTEVMKEEMTTERHGMKEEKNVLERRMEAMREEMAAERKDMKEAMKALNDHMREERTALERRIDMLISKAVAAEEDQSYSNRVRLDLRGTVFTTSRDTLCNMVKDSLFDVNFNGRDHKDAYLTMEPDGTFFVDRKPDVFALILEFMEHGHIEEDNITGLSTKELRMLASDAVYYHMPSLIDKVVMPQCVNVTGDVTPLVGHLTSVNQLVALLDMNQPRQLVGPDEIAGMVDETTSRLKQKLMGKDVQKVSEAQVLAVTLKSRSGMPLFPPLLREFVDGHSVEQLVGMMIKDDGAICKLNQLIVTSFPPTAPGDSRTRMDHTAWSSLVILMSLVFGNYGPKLPSSLPVLWAPADLTNVYDIDALTMTIATKSDRGKDSYDSFVHGAALAMDDIVTFSFKLLNVGGGSHLMVGVAPAAITTATDKTHIYEKCGWYVYCNNTTLCSGPPANHNGKEYGKKGRLANGCEVRVNVNRSNGTISFAINGDDRGVAYQGVFSPNDMLYPCVAMYYVGQSVQLI